MNYRNQQGEQMVLDLLKQADVPLQQFEKYL